MDRRDNPEISGNLTDEQLQKAFEVISLSYEGENPDRIYREATRCFDCLIEISYGNEAIKEFARRRGIDMKYLVDGASFVISKMHFNPEGNHYLTLGLPQNISHEELGRRWKKLMLLYHPDRQRGNEEWYTERAKKVNEAYAELKDETRRAEYDRRLHEQMLHQKLAASPTDPPPQHHRSSREFSRRSRRGVPSSDRSTLRRFIPKILFGVYLLIALVVFGVIYLQNRSSELEAELVSTPAKMIDRTVQDQQPQATPASPQVEEITPKAPVAVSQDKREERRVMPKNTAVPPSPIQIVKKWFQPKEERPVTPQEATRKEAAMASSDTEPKPRHGATTSLFPVRPHAPEPKPSEHGEEQTAPHIEPVRAFSEPTQPLQLAVTKAPPEVKPQAAPPQKSDVITKEEAEEFMQRYIHAYTSNDLNAFMSLFSRSAVENNALTYNDIRKAYKETFSEKINYYKVLNMDIRTDGPSANVTGTYNVNRYISSEDRWVKFSGRIAWKLIREHNQIRIISVMYDK